MELRLPQLRVLEKLDRDIVCPLFVAGDGAASPSEIGLNCRRVSVPLEGFIKV
jgi:hypothetical protein